MTPRMVNASAILASSVLIVDDLDANVQLLLRLLRAAGYTSVTSTMDSREVCDLHRKNRYDLILLDVLMPGMDGFQVIEALKEMSPDGYLPVLVITAQPNHKLRALQAGARDFISKPFELAEVLARVHNMLESRLLHNELYDRNEQLERLVKELDQFAYVASHDLKAPLRAIGILAHWIEDDAGDKLDADGRAHLALLMSRVARMGALVDGVLAYARAGRSPMEVESVALEPLVRDVVELLSLPPGVSVTVEGTLPTILAPRSPLHQIWMNLVSNALKHGTRDHSGHIRLGVHGDGDDQHYYVADDGPGIEPQYHDRIFALFQTLEARDKVENTGIGLAIVKKLIEQQGGRIWVTSALGDGAIFHFTYPPSRVR